MRINRDDIPFFDSMKKLQLHTFLTVTIQNSLKVARNSVIVKADRSFFSKLVVVAKARELEFFDVYSYELGPVPWALATPHGQLYKTDKSALLEASEKISLSLHSHLLDHLG